MNQALPNQTNGSNPLDQLADVTLGEPISWWPLAWGWWALLLVITIAIYVALSAYIKARKRTALKREALLALTQVDLSSDQAARNMHAILKNCVLAYWPKHQVAHLSGDAWKTFLSSQLVSTHNNSSKTDVNSHIEDVLIEDISALESSLYAKSLDSNELPKTLNSIQTWIKKAVPPNADALERNKSQQFKTEVNNV